MAINEATGGRADQNVDVLIVGGGLNGLTLGGALAGAGVRTAVIDLEDPAKMIAQAYDGRASAIAHASARVFQGIGVWDAMAAAAEPILDIRVADGHPVRGISPLFLHYDHRDVGDEPFGYIVENRHTRQALLDHARQLPLLWHAAPAEIASLDRDAHRVEAHLADGTVIRAELAIAADGRFSRTRRDAGIGVSGMRYRQTSIVCTVRHERAHNGVAVELFLPGGPFAMLPMTDQRSNVVWSERADLAPIYLALDDAAFLDELERRFGDWLGPIELVGPRFSYPLGVQHAERYTDRRLALVGDAAHAIHPIAGQGLNLGLRDVAALAELIVDAKRLGLDAAGPSVLDRYARWRRFDNMMLIAVTDGLTRLFSNDIGP
ncbi:MAG: UbiH/UbiF/VisC/COQ6 family ubiquinone biosynthesis hydroxylase, partial [Alphaproteobacteria bacterium]|nr:UbiH/UbiF/VisC/COQ6 family ubiquinone biosynthesis hydroxylase [Alphaproteobacteria bacterium]